MSAEQLLHLWAAGDVQGGAASAAAAAAASPEKSWEEINREASEYAASEVLAYEKALDEYGHAVIAWRSNIAQRDLPYPDNPLRVPFTRLYTNYVRTRYPHLPRVELIPETPRNDAITKLDVDAEAAQYTWKWSRGKLDCEQLVFTLCDFERDVYLPMHLAHGMGYREEIPPPGVGDYFMSRISDEVLLVFLKWAHTYKIDHLYSSYIARSAIAYVRKYVKKYRAHLVDYQNYKSSNVQLALERIPGMKDITDHIIGPMVSSRITPTDEGSVKARRGRETVATMLHELQQTLRHLSPEEVQSELMRIHRAVGAFAGRGESAEQSAVKRGRE